MFVYALLNLDTQIAYQEVNVPSDIASLIIAHHTVHSK